MSSLEAQYLYLDNNCAPGGSLPTPTSPSCGAVRWRAGPEADVPVSTSLSETKAAIRGRGGARGGKGAGGEGAERGRGGGGEGGGRGKAMEEGSGGRQAGSVFKPGSVTWECWP